MWWNLSLSRSVPSGMWHIPSSSSAHCIYTPYLFIRYQLSPYCSACAQVTLFYFLMSPKCKNSDTGNSDMPKRGCKMYVCTYVCIHVCINVCMLVCMHAQEKTLYILFSTSCVSGIHWGFGNVSPTDKGGLRYRIGRNLADFGDSLNVGDKRIKGTKDDCQVL